MGDDAGLGFVPLAGTPFDGQSVERRELCAAVGVMARLAAAESPLVDELRRARVALDPELIDVRRAVHLAGRPLRHHHHLHGR